MNDRPWRQLVLLPSCRLGLLLLLIPFIAAQPAPAASPIAPGKVVMSQDEHTATLANSQVALVFNTTRGTLSSFRWGGRELLAGGGGYVQIAFTSRKDLPHTTWDFRVVRKSDDLIEVAFVNVNPDCPFDLSSHYILRSDEPGFHNYLTWAHNAERSPGVIKLGQYNFALRIDSSLFTVAAVDDSRIVPFPKADLLTPEHSVMDSTYKLPTGGYYSKYFLAADMDENHLVHGAMGDGIGIWLMMPSHEHLNGGPEHQELTVHQAGASQILLAHATGAHFGAGILASDSMDGSWIKASAPWFIYVNSGTQPAMWKDAKARAQQQAAAWPYPWLDNASFQLNRGGVSGMLQFEDHSPIAGARVILATHEDVVAPLLWQQQWRGYRFYGWADRNGEFQIPKVRPGVYDLYAWQPGTFGYFVKRSIALRDGGMADLGQLIWSRPVGRQILWQIGTPDHSAAEFGFAENFRQWGLWEQIARGTPDGVRFVIGKSHDRDWPFQMAVTQNQDRSWHAPAWRVEFENAASHIGKGVVTLGIAAYEGKRSPQLNISLNGDLIGSISDLQISGASHRSGIHAGYQEREIVFDAAKLHAGANTLSIVMPPPDAPADKVVNTPSGSLLWDSLRLETTAQ